MEFEKRLKKKYSESYLQEIFDERVTKILILETYRGSIFIELLHRDVPLVREIIAKALLGEYDGMMFYNCNPYFVQLRKKIEEKEMTDKVIRPYLRNLKGSVGLINSKRNPSKALLDHFYICMSEIPEIDGEYTIFGRVVKGLDVLNKVWDGNTVRRAYIEKGYVARPPIIKKFGALYWVGLALLIFFAFWLLSYHLTIFKEFQQEVFKKVFTDSISKNNAILTLFVGLVLIIFSLIVSGLQAKVKLGEKPRAVAERKMEAGLMEKIEEKRTALVKELEKYKEKELREKEEKAREEEEKKRLEEERKRKLEEEKRQAELERKKAEEELKLKKEIEALKKSAEEERKKAEELRKLMEIERNRAEIERKKLEEKIRAELTKQISEEERKKREEELRKAKQEEEKKRLEEARLKFVEEKKKKEEENLLKELEKRKKEEEKKRIKEEKLREKLEREKAKEEERKRKKEEEIRKELERMMLKEEERKRKEEEKLKKELEKKMLEQERVRKEMEERGALEKETKLSKEEELRKKLEEAQRMRGLEERGIVPEEAIKGVRISVTPASIDKDRKKMVEAMTKHVEIKKEIKKKGKEEIKREVLPKIAQRTETQLDLLYELLEKYKTLKLTYITQTFGIDKEEAIEWCNILVEHGLAELKYPAFGDPILIKK
ncbi:MAG: peptidylprolyl isomerase [Candidatus Pacearchaeota archaeon]